MLWRQEIKQSSVYLNKLPGKYSLNQLRPVKCLLKHTKILLLEKARTSDRKKLTRILYSVDG